MKIYKKIIILTILLVFYAYIANIALMENNIVVFEGSQLNINKMFGINISGNNYEVMQASTQLSEGTEKNEKLDVKLFNTFKVKELNLKVIPQREVVPLGNSVALKVYTKGVLVVGTTEIKDINNKKYKPFETTNIKEGDEIIELNGKVITNTEDLIKQVNFSQGKEIYIKYITDDEEKIESLTPVQVSKNEYKIGLWVRDAAAGVGTLTFYEPKRGRFWSIGSWNF
ncbi:MAG: SpoIVB peptidase S55 domain-containing protein [Clostridia bacterium]|nr:SpoIVB peptidase S55 domain-containing protein [Clostridia bacterium]